MLSHSKLFLVFSILLLSSNAYSESLDTSLSNDAVRLQYATPLQNNGLNLAADFLHHENDADLGGLGLYVRGHSKASTGQQKSGIGGKLIYFNSEETDTNGMALALGGFLKHTLSAANLVSFRGDFYYAPGIVSFGDADRYVEASVRAEYSIMEHANVFAGLRKVEVGLDKQGDTNIDDGAFAGLIIHF
jgi:hypothetical protein